MSSSSRNLGALVFVAMITLGCAAMLFGQPDPRGAGAVKTVNTYLLAVTPGTTTVSQVISVDPRKCVVHLSTAVEANGIGNSTAPNGTALVEFTATKLVVRVEKEDNLNRYVSVQVVEYE